MIKYGDLTLFQFLDQQLHDIYPDKTLRRRLMYRWENIFGYVGALQQSLVEAIFEDKDFDDSFDPEHADPLDKTTAEGRVSIWPRGPI